MKSGHAVLVILPLHVGVAWGSLSIYIMKTESGSVGLVGKTKRCRMVYNLEGFQIQSLTIMAPPTFF